MYLIYMYKEELALNNLKRMICHKIQPNQTSFTLVELIDLVELVLDKYIYSDMFLSPTFSLIAFVSSFFKRRKV